MTTHQKKEKHQHFKKHESSPHDTDHVRLQTEKTADNASTKAKDTQKSEVATKKNEKGSSSADTSARTPVVLSSLGTEETELKAFFEQIVLPRLREQLRPYHDNLIPTPLLRRFQDLLNHIEDEFREFSHTLEQTTHTLKQGNKRAFKGAINYLERDLPSLKKNIETLVNEVEQAVKDAKQNASANIEKEQKPKRKRERT